MLKKDSETLVTMLRAMTPDGDTAFFNSYTPLTGDQAATIPFLAYRLREQPSPSKDIMRVYDLELTVVSDTYNEAATGYDLVRDYMKTLDYPGITKPRFVNGDTDYINEKEHCIAVLNYTLKIYNDDN